MWVCALDHSLECISVLVCALECVHLCVALYDCAIELCFLWFSVPEASFADKSCSCCGHQSMWVCALYQSLACISVLVCALQCVHLCVAL